MKLADTKVGTRLAAGFSLVLVMLAAIVGIGAWRLHQVSETTTRMVDQVLAKERLVADWAGHTNINGARTISVAESTNAARQQQIQAKIKETSAAISEIQKKLDALAKNAEETDQLQRIAERRKAYIAARDEVFTMKKTDEDNAARLIQSRLEPALEEYTASIRKLAAYEGSVIAGMNQDIVRLAAASQWMLAMLGAIAVLLGIAVTVIVSCSIVRQLGGEPAYAVRIASAIAAGDLTMAIRTRPGDSGSLMQAMKTMQQGLAELASQVRAGSDGIAANSKQIAAGNMDLSARTEQQASSLEETASSMEELIGTVRQNADNARQAEQLALSASEVAGKGGGMVAQVVDTMISINEASRKIVNIIGVIDGIAFRTNILALNAAVEAARAGEQGRGFAVVAAEVRSLAHRSAAAAKEIKALIDDSVQKVDAGARLVNEAGSTMEEIVGSVRRVSDIMAEISAATREQTAGIDQINQAISQMDQVTQQNASLVEEAAAASQTMQEQAGNLVRVVSVFRINSGLRAAR